MNIQNIFLFSDHRRGEDSQCDRSVEVLSTTVKTDMMMKDILVYEVDSLVSSHWESHLFNYIAIYITYKFLVQLAEPCVSFVFYSRFDSSNKINMIRLNERIIAFLSSIKTYTCNHDLIQNSFTCVRGIHKTKRLL